MNKLTNRPSARTLICDPPWPGMGTPYSSMSLKKIAALPMNEIAAESAQLLLWVPGSLLGVAIQIAERSWGYKYRQAIVWFKSRPGRPTRYLMPNTEFLLYFTKGDAAAKVRGQQTLIIAPTDPIHSAKPAEAFAIAERIGEAPFAELFSRSRPSSSENWLVWGGELEEIDFSLLEDGFPVAADFISREVA